MFPHSLPKLYVDRAVQTDSSTSSRTSPSLSPSHEIQTAFSIALPLVSHSADETMIMEEPFQEDLPSKKPASAGAYIQSEVLKTGKTVDLAPSRKACIASAIGSGYPSTVGSSAMRIVSLPDIIESPENNSAIMEKQTRIVSMPARGKHGTLGFPGLSSSPQLDTTCSTDISYHYMESPKMSRGQQRPYPSDIPQTPSPPSSPESVMIIGNEGQVSGSFLRSSCTDEHGWITWASSPPRPIPALHGPLSLPYARCPSGAEGTIMDGDDLSHKIWGLGVDDAPGHSRSSKSSTSQALQSNNSSNCTAIQTTVNDTGRETQHLSFQRQRDAIIDLSQPSTFTSRLDIPIVPHRHAPITHYVQPNKALPAAVRNSSLSTQLRDIDLNLIGRPECYESDRREFPVNRGHTIDLMSNTLGLGLKWDGLLGFDNRRSQGASSAPDVRSDGVYNRLNTAAPAFVPQGSIPRAKVDLQSAYTMQKQGHSSQQHERPSAFEIAQQYRARQDYHVPTPPSTSSPLWTPIFPQLMDTNLSTNKAPSAQLQNPNVYSPNSNLDGYSTNIAAMIAQLNGHEYGYNTETYSPSQNSSTQTTSLQSQIHASERTSEHSLTRSWSKEISVVNHDDQQEADEEIQFSSERRRNLSHQHPRSIPLARLIQRRLSSVVEEDANNGHDSLSPLIRKEFPNSYQKLSSSETSDSHHAFNQVRHASKKVENIEGKLNAAQKCVESALAEKMKGPPNSLDESKAIVKLPRNNLKVSSRSSQKSNGATNKKQPDEAHEKENNDAIPSGSTSYKKTRNKNKRRPE